MGTEPIGPLTLIGRPTDDGTTYTASWLHYDGEPDSVLAHLSDMWEQTFARDTEAMTARLLADNWDSLATDATGDETAIAGVGVTDEDLPLPLSESLRSGCENLAWHGDAYVEVAWLYLLHAETDEVQVFEADEIFEWRSYGRFALADLATPAARARIPALPVGGPLRQWAAGEQAGEHVPALDGYPPHLIHLALAVLAGGGTAAIDAETFETTGGVWLPGAGHMVSVQAAVVRETGTAILPRPLGGQSLTVAPALLVTASQVADTCQELDELLDDVIAFHAALRVMARVGHDGADNLAEEWARNTLGGTASGEDVATARRVLAGIEAADPKVLGALPPIPIDVDDSSRTNEPLLAVYEQEVRFEFVYTSPWDELSALQRDRLLDALVAGFQHRFHDAVATTCRTAITAHDRLSGPDNHEEN